MSRVSAENKLRIKTLYEKKLGYRTIVAIYPKKKWSLSTVKAICNRADLTGTTIIRKTGSGRLGTVCTTENIKILVN